MAIAPILPPRSAWPKWALLVYAIFQATFLAVGYWRKKS